MQRKRSTVGRRLTNSKSLKHRYNPVDALYSITYASKIKAYAEEDIKCLLSEGITVFQISSYIREKGYKDANLVIRVHET